MKRELAVSKLLSQLVPQMFAPQMFVAEELLFISSVPNCAATVNKMQLLFPSGAPIASCHPYI